MAVFTAALSYSQSADCGTVSFHDTSSYADEAKNTFVSRVLYLYDAYGNTLDINGVVQLTTTAIPFSFASYPSDILPVSLNRDIGVIAVLVLSPITPVSGSVYTVTSTIALRCFLNTFNFGLIADVGAQQGLLSDSNFYNSYATLFVELNCIETAETMGSVSAIQQHIDIANQLKINDLRYF